MTRVLVTGSTGNVGAEVVRGLHERSVACLAAVTPRHLTAPPGPGVVDVPRVAFDFEDPATFAGALAGVEKVFLLRPPRISDPKRMRPFIAAMVAAGVRHAVFLSVQGAERNAFVPHHGIERDLARSGLPFTFLRPSFFMQNLTSTHADDIRVRDEVFVPAGSGRTNFVDARDVGEAAAIVLAEAGHAGSAYTLTGSETLTYDDVAAELSRACGRTITYARPSGRAFARRMRLAGHDAEYVSVMRAIYLVARLGMAGGTTTDLERLLGRPPRTFAAFARESATCLAPEGP